MSRLIRTMLTGLTLTTTVLLGLLAAPAASAAPSRTEATAATATVTLSGTCSEGAAIRSGPYLQGTTIRGRCYPSHSVTIFCKVSAGEVPLPGGAATYIWVNARDNTTGVAGWISAAVISFSYWDTPWC